MNFRQFNNNHYQTMKRKQSKSLSQPRLLTSSEKPTSARKLSIVTFPNGDLYRFDKTILLNFNPTENINSDVSKIETKIELYERVIFSLQKQLQTATNYTKASQMKYKSENDLLKIENDKLKSQNHKLKVENESFKIQIKMNKNMKSNIRTSLASVDFNDKSKQIKNNDGGRASNASIISNLSVNDIKEEMVDHNDEIVNYINMGNNYDINSNVRIQLNNKLREMDVCNENKLDLFSVTTCFQACSCDQALETLFDELEDEQLQDELGCVTIDHIVNGIIKNDQLKQQIISGLGLKVLVNDEKNKEIQPCVNLDDIEPLELLHEQEQRTRFVPTYTNTSAIQKL
eukprot:124211_1